MRLIDADKLMLSLADWELQEAPIHTYEKPKEFTADDMQRMIWRTIRDCESAVEEQPTVKAIPIDKPFLKMRYGDYVVYNKKWLVNHLQTEWDILQGKEYQPSIPVEWIKKWCNKEHNRKSLEERLLKRYGVITMLEDWEKENE